MTEFFVKKLTVDISKALEPTSLRDQAVDPRVVRSAIDDLHQRLEAELMGSLPPVDPNAAFIREMALIRHKEYLAAEEKRADQVLRTWVWDGFFWKWERERGEADQ